jgi:hypothetical protein
MLEPELASLWNELEQKTEATRILNLQSWVLQLQTLEYLQTEKAKSGLRSLGRKKICYALLGVIWVLALVWLVIKTMAWSNIFLVLSLSGLALFSLLGILAYIRHYLLIGEIDKSEALLEVQQKTARLQDSTLQIVRLLFLQAPLYSSFFWSPKWIREDPAGFWGIAFPITLLILAGSVWLYRNIHYRNSGKKWFRLIFSNSEWTSLVRARQYLEEIEAFRKENIHWVE